MLDIRGVQFAILETDGTLSVFPYPGERPASASEAGVRVKGQFLPITIVEDGYLSKENLQKAGKDTLWLQKILQEKKASLAETFLLTVDGEDNVVFVGKEYP